MSVAVPQEPAAPEPKVSVVAAIVREHAALEQQVRAAEQRASVAEWRQRKAEQSLKQVEDTGKRGQQLLAKATAESAVALLTSAIAIYISTAADPQHARQRLCSYLSARILPVLGSEIPPAPFGPDAEL